jgi:hypothetical protein
LAIQDANALLSLEQQADQSEVFSKTLLERLAAAPGMTAEALGALRFPRDPGLEVRLQRALVLREDEALEKLSLFTATVKRDDPIDYLLVGLGVLRAESWSDEIERSFDKLWEAVYAPPAQRFQRLQLASRPVPRNLFGWPPVDRSRFLEPVFSVAARRTCEEAQVALQRYRLTFGKWPAKVIELVPRFLAEVPIDPYDGGPLRSVEGELYGTGVGSPGCGRYGRE